MVSWCMYCKNKEMAKHSGKLTIAMGAHKNTPAIRMGRDQIQKNVSANMKHMCQTRICDCVSTLNIKFRVHEKSLYKWWVLIS